MRGDTMIENAAEVFPPGEFIKEELDARGWTQVDFATILGKAPHEVSQIITGKRSITPATATAIAEAFGTSAELWMNLQNAFKLSQIKRQDNLIAKRAKLYDFAPIREMVRRGWVEGSDNIQVLEKRVMDFFEVKDLDQNPIFLAHAARKSTSYDDATPAQLAWLFRAKKLANYTPKTLFSKKNFPAGLANLRTMLRNPEDTRAIPHVLSEMGVRFLVIEPLPSTKIDGVCFWLNSTSPVVAVSLRYDRIDWFWHTLFHELGHVQRRDGLNKDVVIDTDLVGDSRQNSGEKPISEKRADEFAIATLIPEDELRDFIARVHPLYSQGKIQGFANRIGVHPGIVVGQLQFREKITYAHNRKMLAKVRSIVTSTALTDGWGHSPQGIH